LWEGLCCAGANRTVMVAAGVIEIGIEDELVGVAPEVRDRLAAYFADVASGLVRSEQRHNAELYARGLIWAGARKSLEPMVARLGGGKVEYEALQHFLADSPWDPGVVDRAVAERVCAVIEPEAWVLDDTGVPKDGKHSPGVKRQYSGTLGKIGSCQIAVSLHAVSAKGTAPLGFRLYLPEDWCQDPVRRRETKIPAEVEFATKPALGGELVARAAGWKVRRAPSLLRADREPQSIRDLALGLGADAFQAVAFRDTDGQPLLSRFAFVRVIAAHHVTADRQEPREEWLIIEWPEDHDEPTDYWISNLPAATEPERLARLARLRWMIELDYKQLKGELGLDHYEGRSYLGFHHHCTLVTAAHGFLTLERADPNHRRPA